MAMVAVAKDITSVLKEYRLVRMRPTEARTGPGGPGDLAWVWPFATFILLLLVLRRKQILGA